MGWWSCEYLPSLWDSGDEATGPQIVETTPVGRSPGARTPHGRRHPVRLRPITCRHVLVTHTGEYLRVNALTDDFRVVMARLESAFSVDQSFRM